jgi:hypothetical protein
VGEADHRLPVSCLLALLLGWQHLGLEDHALWDELRLDHSHLRLRLGL